VKRSTERFLTTHTGSLPRPEDLIRTMFAKEEGVPVDAVALTARIRAAVAEAVGKQATAGIAVVNDGEMSKPSYATYVKDRLTGFGGASHPLQYQDLVDFPGMARRVFGDPGRARRRTPACTGPITVRDRAAAAADADNLKVALAGARAEEGFLTAAPPGVISLFFRDEHYGSHEKYLFAIAEAMRHEYEAVARAGFVLQIDCPDLAMGRHTQFRDLTLAQFRNRMMLNIEALNRATMNIPESQLRMHMCWGNYPGPHHCDVPFKDIIDLVWRARPHAIQFEAANPRHAHEFEMFEGNGVPEGKVLIPGVVECQSNYIEHPELIAQRIGRYADLVGRDNVMAGVDCGFSVHVGSGGVDRDIVWAKLAALAEGARLASAKYW
jgi:5-methyltetrahydropteroyltriglutamate--homocysteine methyltransferase